MATESGTHAYRNEHGDEFGRTYFRQLGDFAVSSIGMGTYLGDPTDEVDEAYHNAITTALSGGINVLDTAINYRCQRSERVVGQAIADSNVDRESVFVATKGGFVPFDGDRPDNPGAFVTEEYVDSGLIKRNDLVRGSHCIAPEYIDDQLNRSLDNLGVDTIDCYYVHNPETQLLEKSEEELYDQLEATFTRLEERADEGDIRHYGIATWTGLRVPRGRDDYLSLREVVSRARNAAKAAENTTTHFRVVQLPFNVVMADAFTVESQDGPEGDQSALWFAHEAGLNVMTSASIAQGDLAEELPDDVAERLNGDTTAQQAINFARSAPGVTCSLVGASDAAHVEENLDAGRFDPLGANAFDAVFE
ncbi:aldo/keto reductase [Haladaptatus pallidirubidus]|uniref:Aldo/keto reductase n=1 Tax=Haladaptatus pallidirubidus TaxID=1008152 RepID=A0AAV3UKN5_9EURY|nr:aldo/keto reductase [Haladaptatus pallidirubidus]